MRFASAGFQGKTQVKLTFSKIGIRHLKPACFTGCRALFRTENKGLEARFEPSGGSGPDAPPRGRPPRHRWLRNAHLTACFSCFCEFMIFLKTLRLSRKFPCGRTRFFGTRKSEFNPGKTPKCACCKMMLNPTVKTPANQSLFHHFCMKYVNLHFKNPAN